MAVNRDRALVKDIIDHASEAVAISGGRCRGDLDTDLQFRYAGERLIEIVGEAAGKLSLQFRKQQPEIPWNLIIGMRNRLTHVTELQVTAATAKAKTEARKEAEKLTRILAECDEWERQTMLPLAQARIKLDLDDGVKTNYLKLGEALAPIAGLAAKEEE